MFLALGGNDVVAGGMGDDRPRGDGGSDTLAFGDGDTVTQAGRAQFLYDTRILSIDYNGSTPGGGVEIARIAAGVTEAQLAVEFLIF